MHTIKPYAIGAVIVACIFGILSRSLYIDSESSFWSNFFLNVVAELVGFVGTLVLGAIIAQRVASSKLDQFAPRFVGIIRSLRKDSKIEPETARACVMCAVGLISDDHLKQNRSTVSVKDENCDVCGQMAETHADGRCQHCNLSGNIWKLKDDFKKR